MPKTVPDKNHGQALVDTALQLAKAVGAIAFIVMTKDPEILKIISSCKDSPEAESGANILILVASPTQSELVGNTFAEDSIDSKLLDTANTLTKHIQDKTDTKRLIGEIGEGIVVGLVSAEGADCIVVYDPAQSQLIQNIKQCIERVNFSVLRTILSVAFELSNEGREGSPIGTGFIIGDHEEVLKRSHQIVLNPYTGHKPEDCNAINPDNRETIKEFSQLDGMFIVSKEGQILAAGRYLDVDAKGVSIPKGLGGRNVSAAAITMYTESVAIIVSQSGGIVRFYKDGKIIGEICPL